MRRIEPNDDKAGTRTNTCAVEVRSQEQRTGWRRANSRLAAQVSLAAEPERDARGANGIADTFQNTGEDVRRSFPRR